MTAPRSSRFLDLRALAALHHLRFETRQRIEGSYSGRHSSRHQGGAGEFADFRQYTEGEDLRRLDWKVLARTGRAYTRLFQDETNLACLMAIDASSSMLFGSRGSKLEYVQYLATALSHMISRQQDQVGLAVIAAGLREFMAPGSTATHIARLQEIIADLTPDPSTQLGDGLRELFQQVGRRGVLLVMSDFLVDDVAATFGALRLFRRRQWDGIILHIVHPEEERLPEGRVYRFLGLEGESFVDCRPEEIRASYQQGFERHAETVRTLALSAGCDYRRVSTGLPYLRTLGEFLVERTG